MQDDAFHAARSSLLNLLDDVGRGDLRLGTGDFCRLDRVLLHLAGQGIRPDDPRAIAWIAPILSSSPAEQAHLHARFQARFGDGAGATGQPAAEPRPAETPEEAAYRRSEVRRSRWRRWSVALLAVVFLGVAGLVSYHYVGGTTSSIPGPGTPGKPELNDPLTPAGPVKQLTIDWLDMIARPLVLIPLLVGGGFIFWTRTRRLWLVNALGPAAAKPEKVALAAVTESFYASPATRRALGAFRRHRLLPDGRLLDVLRTVRSTVRAGGRPELRFGSRPRTPEYTLLVDCEAPRDHLTYVADLLMAAWTREHIVAARYDYFGDPRRLVSRAGTTSAGRIVLLSDLVYMHPTSINVLLAAPETFFDSLGRPQRWFQELKEAGPCILLSPAPAENWSWAARQLEREGVIVAPATSSGVIGCAERLKLGVDVPAPPWHRIQSRRRDLPTRLEETRALLLDPENPGEGAIGELLIELRLWLDAEAFDWLQALAVFPSLEPALTLHLGHHLRDGKGNPLLTEERYLSLSRLPWLRLGRMPTWFRLALIKDMSPERLAEATDLIQAFLQPARNPRDGSVTIELSRRRTRNLRGVLLQWIGLNPGSEMSDHIFVGALQRRDPKELAVLVPETLARRLRDMFRGAEWQAIALAALLAVPVWLFHRQIVEAMKSSVAIGALLGIVGALSLPFAARWLLRVYEEWRSGQPPIDQDAAKLRSLGYEPALDRRLTGMAGFGLGIGTVAIVASSLSVAGGGFGTIGGAAIGVTWPIFSIFALALTASMAQIASAFPVAGGVYQWAAILGGRAWGWFAGMISLVGLALLLGGTAQWAGFQFALLGFDDPNSGFLQTVIMAGILLSQVMICRRGIRLINVFVGMSTFLLIGSAVAIVATTLPLAQDISRLFTFANFTATSTVAETTDSMSMAVLFSFILPLFVMIGMDVPASTAEETRDPARSVPRGMIGTVVATSVVGFLVMASIVLSEPDSNAAATEGWNLGTMVLNKNFSPSLVQLALGVSWYMCGLCVLVALSRTIFAIGRDGGLPAWADLSRVDPISQSPNRALWLGAILAFASVLHSESVSVFITYSPGLLYISYAMPVAAGWFSEGRRWTRFGPFRLGAWSKPCALVGSLGAVAAFALPLLAYPYVNVAPYLAALAGILVVGWLLTRRRFTGSKIAPHDPTDRFAA